MDERDKKTELLVGLFLFIGLLLLGGLILQFGSVRELMKTTYEITVPFPDATGVKVGTPVMLGGAKIGKVPRMPKLNDQFNGLTVPMEIYEDKKIPRDAKFSVGTSGLLGDAYIEIRPSGKDTELYIEPGTFVESQYVTKGGGLSDLTSTADQIGRRADQVLADVSDAAAELKDALSRVNKGALSDATLGNFRKSMEHLEKSMENVSTEIVGDENAANLKQAIADVKDAAAAFKRTSASLENTSKKLDDTLTKLDPAVAKADKVMTSLDEALVSFKKTSDNLSTLTSSISKGGSKGLLPALMSDVELKDDFKSLIDNLRRHGVVWGYKDDAEAIRAREAAQKAQPTQQQPPKRGLFNR